MLDVVCCNLKFDCFQYNDCNEFWLDNSTKFDSKINSIGYHQFSLKRNCYIDILLMYVTQVYFDSSHNDEFIAICVLLYTIVLLCDRQRRW